MCLIFRFWRGARNVATKFYGYFRKPARRLELNEREQLNESAQKAGTRVQLRPPFNCWQKGILKRQIYKNQAKNLSMTSFEKLLEKLENEMNFKPTPASLRRLLQEMGLRPVTSSTNKEYFMEPEETRAIRTKYIEDITKYRQEGRPIVYIGVSSVRLPRTRNLQDHRIVTAYAISNSGLIPGATAEFKYTIPAARWYYLIHYNDFKDWVKNKLLPYLPANSVVVMYPAPWHNTMLKKAPMEAWLKERHVPFEPKMRKIKLQELINEKENHKDKTIEKMLVAKNHTILHLPAFQNDLNPLELLWMDVQKYVDSRKQVNSINHILNLTKNALAGISNEKVFEYCYKTSYVEYGYRQSGKDADMISQQIAIEEAMATSSSSDMDVQVIDEEQI